MLPPRTVLRPSQPVNVRLGRSKYAVTGTQNLDSSMEPRRTFAHSLCRGERTDHPNVRLPIFWRLLHWASSIKHRRPCQTTHANNRTWAPIHEPWRVCMKPCVSLASINWYSIVRFTCRAFKGYPISDWTLTGDAITTRTAVCWIWHWVTGVFCPITMEQC